MFIFDNQLIAHVSVGLSTQQSDAGCRVSRKMLADVTYVTCHMTVRFAISHDQAEQPAIIFMK